MSNVGVVSYNSNNNTRMNILQQNTSTNHVKPLQGGAADRQIIFLRKSVPQPILPQPKDYRKDDILLTNPGRKGVGGRLAPGAKTNGKTTGTDGGAGGKEMKLNHPQPIAVARRNARERNRVKQVNDGFTKLRQHIPTFIAQAFENSNGRSNKKLSKVETLRMAVEYIRSLEDLLAFDDDQNSNVGGSGGISNISPKSNDPQNDLPYSFIMSPEDDDDDLISTSPQSVQHQYVRINTATNTYEILPGPLYENSENLDPMSVVDHPIHTADSISDTIDNYILQNSLDTNIPCIQIHNGTVPLQHHHNHQPSTGSVDSNSISPSGIYNENSLSPIGSINLNKNSVMEQPQSRFISVFDSAKLGDNFNIQIKSESIDDLSNISLKGASKNCTQENREHLVNDVINNWWEQTPTSS